MTPTAWNVWFNATVQSSILALLATEGIKSVCMCYGKPIKGRAALWLFIGVFLLLTVVPWTETRSLWYCINSLAQGLSAIGIYSFVSRLFKALK